VRAASDWVRRWEFGEGGVAGEVEAEGQGRLPPVMPDYLELSVGGVLSVGGLTGTSFSHGAAVDNVWAREAKVCEGRLAAAEKAFEVVAGPELERLEQTITNLEADQRSLTRAEAERDAWLAQHPEADAPQTSFDLGDLLERLRPAAGWEISPEPNIVGPDRGAAIEPDLGIDFGP